MADGLGARLETPLFEQLTLIGVGLIGSSLARVASRKGLARRIVAYDNDPDVRAKVERLALADVVSPSPEKAVQGADLVILCAPVGAMGEIAKTIAPHLAPGTIVSDVGSVKEAIIEAVAPALPGHVHFVPAHPVAGTEYSGPAAGFATLFLNRWCILTPTPDIDPEIVARVESFWSAAGANVEIMKATHHDLVLAITSHVPHLIAYNIVGTAADLETVTQSEVIKFSAGGFRDFTRIAASDPTMWRDIFLNNKSAVIEMLGRFTEDLIALQRMIRHEDGDGLFKLFTRTRAIRRNIIEQGQETAAPDFGRGVAKDTDEER
ncbi:prephenate/arogenate dehydrogenase family protein [Beijerinckia indica]|uniref:prephenate dehydrogenase n=1 Tax=Beijerinckia indica subsp. indica (strain ATCC 9039 / DSM 1715 / NCIMB 8712) TaxID=395963 RepID=B2IDA5_BEII9|nr:prephenate/arogenate dehydrogenase family protein [Beijerinckia indica]ACB93962.1 Arogenate dehydrogenase [Beijerinckia indica subsp. indica ATCC 9039]